MEKNKGYIALGKGTMVRNHIYGDKIKKIKRKKQKGGVYFADRVLKSGENFFQKGKGFANKKQIGGGAMNGRVLTEQ